MERGSPPWRRCSALTAVVSLLLLWAPSSAGATHVWLGRSTYRLFARASNGYRLRLSTYENRHYHRISLVAENEEGQYVRYAVHGEPKNGRIHAVFPGVGEIDVAMHQTRSRKLPPPKGCRLPKSVIQYGTFEGTIRIRGEMGYTELDTTRAHGAIERSHRQECQLAADSRAPVDRGAFSTSAVLRLVTGALIVNASAPASAGGGGPTGYFSAEAHEERDGMTIARVSPGVSAPGDFETNDALTWANLSPPKPFLGTATYSGPPRATGCPLPCPPPTGEMSGTLRVPLPGLGVIPLTGPGVKATLEWQTVAF